MKSTLRSEDKIVDYAIPSLHLKKVFAMLQPFECVTDFYYFSRRAF